MVFIDSLNRLCIKSLDDWPVLMVLWMLSSNVSCFIDASSIESDIINLTLELVLLIEKHAHRGGELIKAGRKATRLPCVCCSLSQVKAVFCAVVVSYQSHLILKVLFLMSNIICTRFRWRNYFEFCHCEWIYSEIVSWLSHFLSFK